MALLHLYNQIPLLSKKITTDLFCFSFPHQLFIDGKFCNATSGKRLSSINPADESLICEVGTATEVYFL
jgi:hypothetical protein